MKTLQSLNQKQEKLLAKLIKNSLLISVISLSAACTTMKSKANYEPCSVADSAKSVDDTEFNEAFAACRQKAVDGDAVAQKNLAYMFYFGNNKIKQDIPQAIEWFKSSAIAGNQSAIARMQDIETKMVSYNY